MSRQVNVWLDDIRPAPIGFDMVTTAAAAIALFERLGVCGVNRVSLDHDLGTCDACAAQGGMTVTANGYVSCPHNGTGYDVVCWMEERGFWPERKPTVHSANPVGRKRMQIVIDKAYLPSRTA